MVLLGIKTRLPFAICLRWYGTPSEINVDESTYESKYFHQLRVFNFYKIVPKITF